MSPELLDVNVLVAICWPSHVHHPIARRWFKTNADLGWATCPITQSGFVRISSNPAIIGDAVTPHEALSVLQALTQRGRHAFWADEVDLCTDVAFPAFHIMGHRQMTDAYLLSLAIHHGGKLTTLDRSVIDLLPVGSPHHSAVELIPTA